MAPEPFANIMFSRLLKEQEKELLALLEAQQRAFREQLKTSFAKLVGEQCQSPEEFVMQMDSTPMQGSSIEEAPEEQSIEELTGKLPSEPNKRQNSAQLQEVNELDPCPDQVSELPEPDRVSHEEVTWQVATRHRADTSGSSRSPKSPSLSSPNAALKKSLAQDCYETEMPGVSNFPRRVDQFAGALICLSSLMMIVEFEWDGRNAGALLGQGLHVSENTLPFRVADALFDCLFMLEFILQILANGKAYFTRPATIYDVLMVFGCCADLVVTFVDMHSTSVVGKHIMRALNSLRLIRLLKALQWFSGVHLLLRACQSFATSLFWSMVLLTIFMLTGSLMVGNLLSVFILDDLQKFEDRVWIWRHFGTAYRSLYSFYEITFAGSWPAQTRPVLDKVSHFFSMIWVCYITIIVFALIRVITAIFLKDTLDAAHNDAELQIRNNLQMRQKYVTKLEDMFNAIDDGDGMITEEKLDTILANPKVRAYFQTLDLDVYESTALFRLLDDGDGEVTLDEFINGILRCKGTARAIDQVALHTEIRSLDKKLMKLLRLCEKIPGVDMESVSPQDSKEFHHGHYGHGESLKAFRSSLMNSMETPTFSSFNERSFSRAVTCD